MTTSTWPEHDGQTLRSNRTHAVASDGVTADGFEHDGDRNTALVDGLRQKLASLPDIEQAKGILMVIYSIDDDTAFDVLRRWSSITNTKLRDLAADLVAAARQPHVQSFGSLRHFLADRGLD